MKISSCGNSKQNINGKWVKTASHDKSAQDISEVYNAFSSETENFFRKAMALAGRNRVLRVQHILAANGNQEAQQQLEELPVGYLDSPMTNSPTMRRVLSLAFSWSQEWGMNEITPELLMKVAEALGGEENPPFGQGGPPYAAKERIKKEIGIDEQAQSNIGDEQSEPIDGNMKRQVIDTAIQQLQQGMPSNTVAMQFLSDMMKVDPNFANGPYAMMIIAVQNNPEQLREFLQGFN